MASFSTLSMPPSLSPMKYIPYVPPALKPKTKSQAKAKVKPKITEHNLYEDSSHGYDGEWADINDFSTDLLGSNALHSLDSGLPAAVGAASPSGSLHPDGEGDLSTVPPPQMPQSQQHGQEGPDQAAGVEEMDLAVDGLLDGSSPEFPIVLEDDAAGESDSIADIQSGGGPREYQDDNLDVAGMRPFSVENTGGVYNDSFPEQDEPYDDVGMRNQPSATRKRKYALFADTITSPVEVLDHASTPASEESRSAKRRSAQPQAESLAPSPVCTPTSTTTTTLPHARGSHLPPLRVSNDPNAGDVDGGSKDNGADTSDLPRSDLLDLQNRGDGEHYKGVTDKLHSSTQSISPSERRDGDHDFSPDSERGEDKSDDSDSELGESDKDKRRRGPSRTGLKPQGGSTMPTTTLRQLTLSPSRCQSGPKTDITTRSSFPRTSSPGTAVYDSNINYGPSDNIAYQFTDITLCQVPKGSLIVTAIVHCNDMISKSPPNLSAIERNFLGDRGQVIRMTQVSPDSWLLLGYRYDDGGAQNSGTRQSLTQRSENRKISPNSRAANHDAVHPDNRDEEDENGDKDTSNDNHHVTGCDARLNKGGMRFRKRTRLPWLESDEQRLRSYKEKMDMTWNDIFPLFPDRTPGAVQARWYALQEK